tara:strand:+ start:111 stop:908 length:798 start_codon:yes stop_codon:yes gene_type:complete
MSKHQALDTFGRSGNPIIRSSAFQETTTSGERMSLEGAVNKTGILLFLTVLSAAISWNFQGPLMSLISYIGVLTGVIAAISTFGFYFFFIGWIINPRPHLAPKAGPIYAIGMGFMIGVISQQAEALYPGIVIQAVSLTFFVAASLLFAYKTGIIRPTQNFVLIIFAATLGIFLTYFCSFVFSLIMGSPFSMFTDETGSTSWISIGISLFVVAIAALNLVLDFDIIEQADEQGAPKYMEWFGAMALVATLIWLYIEILRLLMKLRR